MGCGITKHNNVKTQEREEGTNMELKQSMFQEDGSNHCDFLHKKRGGFRNFHRLPSFCGFGIFHSFYSFQNFQNAQNFPLKTP